MKGAIRIPTAGIGLLDVFLVYIIVKRLQGARGYALFAAVTLALTPAHFMLSRMAVDFVCILPFGLGWLWCLSVALETDRTDLAIISGLILGAGIYSHIAAWLMMPMFLAITWIAMAVTRRRPALALAVGFGFLVSILPLIYWLRPHPAMLNSFIQRYQVYDTRHLSPLQGLKDFLNYNNVQDKISIYWDTFNPAYLFFSGGSNLALATRRVGVFLLPLSVFFTCGLYDLWLKRGSCSVASASRSCGNALATSFEP